ncbi:MAG: sulfite oxidase heme-binding subunit YedZ [Methylococcaceae bacterium]
MAVLLAICLAFLPGLALVGRIILDDLGADPVATLTHETGQWALRFLLLSLSATPLRKLSHWQWPVRIRRVLGLAAFAYAMLHFSMFLVFDHFFDWDEIQRDIIKRPYITMGFAAYLMMIPLALTSSNYMMRWMGGKHWKALHKLNYFIGITGIVHYFWSVKRDITLPTAHAIILATLLGFRLIGRKPDRRKSPTYSP